MRAQTRSEIRRLLEESGLRPDKSLGQHFLADPNIVDRIVRTATVGEGDRVIEVGAGTGTMTRALVDVGAHVMAFEVDKGLGRLLDRLLGDAVDLRVADVVDVDLATELGDESWVMVANLPYNVGTGVILDTLRHVPQVERMVVMVQREVADRLVAAPGSRLYGLPSVVAGIYATVSLEFVVPPQVFIPVPDVESAVIAIERLEPGPGANAPAAVELATAAFSQRRKMLRRSLAGLFEDASDVLVRAGIEPTARAEELSPDDYLRLADVAG